MARLREAFASFSQAADATALADLADFVAAHAHWLDDHALFMALDRHHAARGIHAWTP
ncbi:MAG: 4-alpha-glucanotransferase, partial [bacterium]